MSTPQSDAAHNATTGDAGAPAPRTDAAGGDGGGGASPCITAPQTCIPGTSIRVLRVALDSLYLSYAGKLDKHWEERLEHYKDCAQSDDLEVKAQAQVKIGEHLFEVKERGSGRFAFVLEDNAFRIALSRGSSGGLPLAHAQVRSALLAHSGPEEAERRLRFVVDSLGKRAGDPKVSRADPCVDFVCPVQMDGWSQNAWVTRAHRIVPYYDRHSFTGWAIGLGGPIAARLYDKTCEIATKSHAEHFFEVWAANGWGNLETVWRLEFQFKRKRPGMAYCVPALNLLSRRARSIASKLAASAARPV